MLNGSINDLPQGGSAEALEPMMYPARLVMLSDLGLQDGKFGVKHVVAATFELPTEATEGDDGEVRPRVLSAFFNIPAGYTSKSKWIQFVELMTQKKGESYADMLGRACQVDVTAYEADGVTKNRINGTAKLGRGMDVAEATSELRMITEDSWDQLDNLDIPSWIKDKIQNRVPAEAA